MRDRPTRERPEYYRAGQLAVRFDVTTDTLSRWVKQKQFPAPVKLSPGCVRWRRIDVEQWEATRPTTIDEH